MEIQEKKRVALYLPLGKRKTQWSGIGGAEKRLSFLISRMDKERFETSIVFRVYVGQEKVMKNLHKYIDDNCNVRFVSSNISAFHLFFHERFDYVLYDDCMVLTLPGVLGACMAKSKRILIFVTVHYAKWTFIRKWHSLIMRCNTILASSIDSLYPSSVGILEKKIKKNVTVTPCALPFVEEYIEASKQSEKTKKIVFAGRLVSSKNPMLLLESISLVKKELRYKGYMVLICGAGVLEHDIVKYIQENELNDVVTFGGPQNMIDILPSSMIFCSLQDNENYPSQSLLEAIACGCYCIATDVGDTRRIVKEDFGCLVKATPSFLANGIINAITMSDEQYDYVREAAQSFAMRNFCPKAAVMHYEKICGDRNLY